MIKKLPANAGDVRELNPWEGKMPCSMKRQPTPVFLTKESHKQRSLEGYNLRGHKGSDTTEYTVTSITLGPPR